MYRKVARKNAYYIVHVKLLSQNQWSNPLKRYSDNILFLFQFTKIVLFVFIFNMSLCFTNIMWPFPLHARLCHIPKAFSFVIPTWLTFCLEFSVSFSEFQWISVTVTIIKSLIFSYFYSYKCATFPMS